MCKLLVKTNSYDNIQNKNIDSIDNAYINTHSFNIILNNYFKIYN